MLIEKDKNGNNHHALLFDNFSPLFFFFAVFFIIIYLMTCNTQALQYGKNTNLSNVDASIIGEMEYDGSAESIEIAGDLNGDGFEDIIIGAPFHDDTGPNSGKVYIIFGKKEGWVLNNNLSEAEVFIHGNNQIGQLGIRVSGPGDINGDGYDDILISGFTQDNISKFFLFFGKENGWDKHYNINDAASSWIGEDYVDSKSGFGPTITGVGDVNRDGYFDFIVGSPSFSKKGTDIGRAYLFFGKNHGWKKNQPLNKSDVIIDGKYKLGLSIEGAGDVNGDQYDDIIFGSPGENNNGEFYLLFGKEKGWEKTIDIIDSDVIFIGEKENDYGHSRQFVDGAADINGDGFDDLIIGAQGNDFNGMGSGQVYIFFGKDSGWTKQMNLSKADASFIGNGSNSGLGYSVKGAGDINGDKYDDLLIGSDQDSIYIVLGKENKWAMRTPIIDADISFVPNILEPRLDGRGDINGDGYDDIIIGEKWITDIGNYWAGKTYIIFPDNNTFPNNIKTIKVYSDSTFKNSITTGWINQTVYLELNGSDGDPNRNNTISINVKIRFKSSPGIKIELHETDSFSGIFRGKLRIMDFSNKNYCWIGALPEEDIIITPYSDPSINAILGIKKSILVPKIKHETIYEDDIYNVQFYYEDNISIQWTFITNASWITWNESTYRVFGAPLNRDVGEYWYNMTIKDEFGTIDFFNYSIRVANTPPIIITLDINRIYEDIEYVVDYNCSDDYLGIIWAIQTNATWLSMNTTNGILFGIPTNWNVGNYWINISVFDGNGGYDYRNFILEVINVNDSPSITSFPILESVVDEKYFYNVNATDIDVRDVLQHSILKGPDGMTISNETGLIEWNPVQGQEGTHEVVIRVTDGNATVEQRFDVTVLPHLIVQISSPFQGQKVKGELEIAGTYTGPAGAILEIRLDNGSWETVTDTGPDWSHSMGTLDFENGQYTFTIKARWGNFTSEEVSVDFEVDNPSEAWIEGGGLLIVMVLLIFLTIAGILIFSGMKGDKGEEEGTSQGHRREIKEEE